MSLDQRVAVITGATGGLGTTLVGELAAHGAKLALLDIDPERLESQVRTFSLPADRTLTQPVNLLDLAGTKSAAAAVLAKFGRIDILINNGGIGQRSIASDTSLEVYRKIMEVNFFGGITLTKAVLPYMIEQNSGQIIVTSSLMGKIGYYNRTGYAASKHALHGFYDSLRLEVQEQNIKILLVCPGYVKTNISIHALNANGESHAKMDKNQERGIPAETCANKILKGLLKNKKEIIFGGKEVFAVWIKRFFPGLFYIIVKNNKP